MLGELIKWNSTEELSIWHRDLDLFGPFFRRRDNSNRDWANWEPRMETYRKDNEYVIRVDLPGVNPNDVNVHTEANVLTVTGERKGEEKGSGYRETFYGKFERQIALPQGVEADKIAARYEHGVLEIHVPLPAQYVGRKVPIQIEQNSNKKIETKAA